VRHWAPIALAATVWISAVLQVCGYAWWWLPIPLAVGGVCLLTGVGFGGLVEIAVLPVLAALRIWLSPSNGVDLTWLANLGEGLRTMVASPLQGLSANAMGLTLGIIDGDTSKLSQSASQELKSMSLTHLTAVSGTNCTILIASALAIAGWLGLSRSVRTVSTTAVLIGYLVLVGNQPSVLRAAAMSLVAIIGLNLGARFHAMHLLSLAVILLIIADPGFATSLGFALSVLATAGVLVLSPPLHTRLQAWLPGWLAIGVAVALAAQLACLPLLVTIQGKFNLGGLAANLLAEPVVAPITVIGFFAAAISVLTPGSFHPAAGALYWVDSVLSQYILNVSHFFAVNAPSIAMPAGLTGVLAAVLLLLGLMLLLRRGWRLRALGAVLLVWFGLLVGQQLLALLPSGTFAPPGWFMVACDVGQGDATVLSGGGQFAVIDVGRDPVLINRCLNRLGVRRISLLVLTHFDMDHVGGLAGALEGRQVTRALLTQFVDVRPGALDTELLLQRVGVPITKVALGAAGRLGGAHSSGAFRWLVLTPHAGGEGSDSSNDGSVSMYWSDGKTGIFTMADLPAKGQARILNELPMWWKSSFGRLPTVLKLSHHGSADQDPAFLSWVHPVITTISVGAGNPYGHPTKSALDWLREYSKVTLRTDQLGSISIVRRPDGGLTWAASGAG